MQSSFIGRAATVALTGLLFGRAAAAQQMTPHDMMNMGARPGPKDPLGVRMSRMGSGTTWIPDAVTIPSAETMAGGWHLVGHGFLFGQYDRQFGARGSTQFGSLNWAMLMASHDLAGGRLQLRTMLSLEAATVTTRGYPLLLQTGETWQGQPLHDRQHPHDLFMELGVLYERPVTRTVGVSLFVAPSGEPALGPVAFMHRPSAMDDPMAPITHHWQDATHIAFGVVTAGLFGHRWKLEGSAFNGREPDERRWGIDPIRLGAYAGRLTINPDDHLSITLGYGFLEAMHRTAASIQYARSLGTTGQLAAALIWGSNLHEGRRSNGVLLEGEAVLDRHHTVFGRIEYAEKGGDELVVTPDSLYRVSAVSLGFIRELGRGAGVTLGLGVRGSVNFLPASLASTYGSRHPVGLLVFARLRPVGFAR